MVAVASTLPTTAPMNEASLDDRICQFLVARGRLKDADLARGRRLHEEDPASGSLVSLLTRLGLVSEREMAEAVSELLHLPLLSAELQEVFKAGFAPDDETYKRLEWIERNNEQGTAFSDLWTAVKGE